MPRVRSRLLMLTVCLLAAGTVFAQNIFHVASIAELQSRINTALPGDQIILNNGAYTTNGAITVGRAGTAAQPILIAAQTVGGVTISGSGAFTVNSSAAFVTIQGFVFDHVGVFSLNPGANHVQVTRNTFNNGAGAQDLNVAASNDNQLDHNLFENRPNGGQFIRLTNLGGTCAGGNALRNWIHHNHFLHNNGGGGNGADPIENGGDSTATEQMTAEFNLIEDCNADPEAISNKSADNIIRYNTLRGNRSHIELRDGNRCQVYGNFILNSTGIRIFGDDHLIYNNYLEGNDVGIRVGSGSDPNHICGQPFTSNDRPDRVHVYNNTIVNNTQSILGETRKLGATDFVLANNIIVSNTGTALTWGDAPANPMYEGNIVFGSLGDGAIPPSGRQRVDPLLVRDANGILHISSGSPAINASVGSFPGLVDDIDGQPRDTSSDGKPPDVGADEFSSLPVTRRPLTAADVGPNAFESDFSITTTPPTSQAVQAGAGTSYGVTVATLSGTPGTVTFSVTGLPAGATGSFSPASVSDAGSSTLNITTSASTPAGTYTLTISGVTATLSHVTAVTLVVNATTTPDFSISISPASQTVTAGGSTTYGATVTASGGLSSAVSFTVTGLPTGASGTFTPSSVNGSGSSTLNVSTSSTTPAGTVTFTITGTGGGLSHSATVQLTVNQPNICTITTATGTFNNTAFPTHSGTFTATFDAIPSVNAQSSAVGLSHGVQTAFSGFANLVVFTTAGTIQARNGGAYAAASTIHFTGGVTYHFRLAINVTAHTYSIFVTPSGGTEVTVGNNFAFRTEQNAATSLDHWGALVNAAPGGTLSVCNFSAQ